MAGNCRGFAQRQAVAFAGLQRQAQAQLVRERRRPRAAAEHELVRLDLAASARRRGPDRPATFDAPARDLGVPRELGALRRDPVLQLRDEAIRRQVTVLRKVHGAGDVHPNAGIERRRLPGVEHLRSDAERAAELGRADFLVQHVRRSAQHQQPLPDEAEVASGQRGELFEAAVARDAEIAQQRRGAANVLGRGRAPELDAPVEEIPRQARLDVERRRGIPHPLEALRHHAGRGERHEMAGHQHAGVLERAAVALRGIAIDERHARSRGARSNTRWTGR